MTQPATAPAQLLRLPDVISTTGLSRSTIYRLADRGEFPAPIKLAARTTAWAAAEVGQWIDAKMAARSAPHGSPLDRAAVPA